VPRPIVADGAKAQEAAMLPIKVALVSKSQHLQFPDVAKVAAAINVQVTRDFAPIWGVNSSIAALPSPDAIGPGIWPVFIVDKLPPGEGGVHLTKHHQPYALVALGASWSLAASHETLEMLADPSGNRLVASQAIAVIGGTIHDAPGKFEYLTEVCDPSEGASNAYLVDDVAVSDFYTPHFFDPMKSAGVRYSFTGALTAPRQVLKDGYLSWYNSTRDVFQQLRFFGQPQFVDLGKPSGHASLRVFVDEQTRPPMALELADDRFPVIVERAARHQALHDAGTARARQYQVA
jgi:hypothetical protein